MSIDSTYIDLFFQDADEHVQLMTESLLDLEKNPEDKEALAACFRSAHTIKSSSAMVGFMDISEFTHRMEDLIGLMQTGQIPINSGMVDVLFQSFDVLKDQMMQVQTEVSDESKEDTRLRAQKLIQLFQEVIDGKTSVDNKSVVLLQPTDDAPSKPKTARVRLNNEHRARLEDLRCAGEQIYEITIEFVQTIQMASARAFLIMSNVAQIATIIQTDPDLNNDEIDFETSFALVVVSTCQETELRKACTDLDVAMIDIRNVTNTEQFEWQTITQESDHPPLDHINQLENTIEAEEKPQTIESSFDRREDRTKTQTVRVDIEKLDKLLNLVAELVIQRGRAFELAQRLNALNGKGGLEEELLDAIVQQGMYLSQLQETVMDSRMVPIGSVFSRFRRVVRDLANSRAKKINLVIEGEETELDKKIIDQIGDPIMHMVRNSLDHGLETPEERIQLGKPPEGTLTLNAEHQGNNIVITVQDDGKGIDTNHLKQKAIERGVLTNEEAAGLSENEALKLIFKSGFSTAKEVTDISGRGVGMDVVRKSIEQLGGTVDIETQVGQGTTFFLKLPLTLAIIQALLVESNQEMYALPITNVAETIRIHKQDIYRVKGQGNVIRLRDEVVPLVNLSKVVKANCNGLDQDRYYVAVLRNGKNYVGLIVDRMVNEQEIVIKPLGSNMGQAPYIVGASILGDGRVILILDTITLIQDTLGTVA